MVFLALAENSIQLVPDGTIFLHIALILLMIWVLNRTLFKPVNRILETRERMTGGSFVVLAAMGLSRTSNSLKSGERIPT